MINNTKKLAQQKLNRHRTEGASSKLSIFEVADLMDMLHRAEAMSHMDDTPSIFHSIAYN